MEWVIIGLIVGVAVLIITLALFILKRKESKNQEVDYQALFNMGIVFAGAGIAISVSTKNPGLIGIAALGIVYMILGIKNKDKWKDKK